MSQRRLPAGPLLEVAVGPTRATDKDALVGALEAVAEQDSSFAYSSDPELGQTILKGMSEAHLDRIVDALQRMLGEGLNVGKVQVAYRERIFGSVEIDHTHKLQVGGAGSFARVRIQFEPGEPGTDCVFANAAGHELPEVFVLAVLKGLRASFDNGVVAGFPVMDSKATLIDGAYHEVDSKARTFEIAARAAVGALRNEGVVELLEPIMAVEVVTPDEFPGGVIGDLNARRGAVQGSDQRDGHHVASALVPLAGMLGYEISLTAMTKGRGRFSMRFDHYAPVPRGVDDDPDRFPSAAAMRA